METIKEAKDFLNLHYKKGIACPCCDQFVKEYKRKVYGRIARLLIHLYHIDRAIGSGYVHIDMICEGITEKGSGDFAKLQFWGLVELQENTDPKKKTSGYWRITDFGKNFVEDKVKIPKYVHILIGKARKFSGPEVGIRACLGKEFNYAKLMSDEW